MEAIILAGGFGTRLSQVVQNLPKAMAPIRGRPFLELLLQRLESSGFERIILSVGYLHQLIQQHFGSRFGSMELEYVIEQSPLGTGGAVRLALMHAVASQVFVLNGDTMVSLDYRAMYEGYSTAKARLAIAVCEMDDTSRYGRVLVDGDIVSGFLEKQPCSGPGLINAGVYVLDRYLFNQQATGEVFSFERDYLTPMVASLRPYAFRTQRGFIDIGVPEDYVRAQSELAGIA